MSKLRIAKQPGAGFVKFSDAVFRSQMKSTSQGKLLKNVGTHLDTYITGWWFQIFFMFIPYLGKIPILTNIFQRG